MINDDSPEPKEMAAAAQPVFEQQPWKWYGKGGYNVPDEAQIQQTIEELVESVESSTDTTCSETGRLVVQREDFEGKDRIRVFLELGTWYE